MVAHSGHRKTDDDDGVDDVVPEILDHTLVNCGLTKMTFKRGQRRYSVF